MKNQLRAWLKKSVPVKTQKKLYKRWEGIAPEALKRTLRAWGQRQYANANSPYQRVSQEDLEEFRDTLAVWKPEGGKEAVLLRWRLSEWCNYNCPYCPQEHSRTARQPGGFTSHAFDNFPVEQWIDAFQRHFSDVNLSLVLTGGEPMLDRKSMTALLSTFAAMENALCIRIDTNASWRASAYAGFDRSKIILMCTFHPSQTTEEKFFRQIDLLQEEGWKIGMVNYVMTRENIPLFESRQAALAMRGIPLNPNPLWNSQGFYTPEEVGLMRRYLPASDYKYRSQQASPEGKKCLYPSLSYEMDQVGKIHVGCHKAQAGQFFDDTLPVRFAGPVPCPWSDCVCLDKYSFLDEVNRNTTTNPLEAYGRELLAKQEDPC